MLENIWNISLLEHSIFGTTNFGTLGLVPKLESFQNFSIYSRDLHEPSQARARGLARAREPPRAGS